MSWIQSLFKRLRNLILSYLKLENESLDCESLNSSTAIPYGSKGSNLLESRFSNSILPYPTQKNVHSLKPHLQMPFMFPVLWCIFSELTLVDQTTNQIIKQCMLLKMCPKFAIEVHNSVTIVWQLILFMTLFTGPVYLHRWALLQPWPFN